MGRARFLIVFACIGIVVAGWSGPASAHDSHRHGHHGGSDHSPSKSEQKFADLARRQTIWAEADYLTVDQVVSRRDCSSGQHGDVFYLPVLVNVGTDSIHCNVPGNRDVLLNLGGWRCLDDHLTPNEDPAADCAAVIADPTGAVTFTATLDGHTLPGYRVDTGNFPVVIPQDTAWTLAAGIDLSGPTTEAYSGFQVVLDPLRCGEHRIDVHVVFGAGTTAEGRTDLTYLLSVGPH